MMRVMMNGSATHAAKHNAGVRIQMNKHGLFSGIELYTDILVTQGSANKWDDLIANWNDPIIEDSIYEHGGKDYRLRHVWVDGSVHTEFHQYVTDIDRESYSPELEVIWIYGRLTEDEILTVLNNKALL